MKKTILDLKGYHRVDVECCATCYYYKGYFCKFFKYNAIPTDERHKCDNYRDMEDSPLMDVGSQSE